MIDVDVNELIDDEDEVNLLMTVNALTDEKKLSLCFVVHEPVIHIVRLVFPDNMLCVLQYRLFHHTMVTLHWSDLTLLEIHVQVNDIQRCALVLA